MFGDLSFTNAAFAINPPRMILLDCDGAASWRPAQQAGAFAGLETARGGSRRAGELDLQDKATDVYKLGLAILRCLNPGKGAATTKDPKRLAGSSTPAEELVARADGADRPGRQRKSCTPT